ncbi:hypothetical protein [Butyrivibrio sp. M55]|uniref:hypothetical protein n=1 Tax=Butyrivibrio sp. M55 TaxID=1855323 RepID=UPI0008DFC8A4|nr:hypothetical protein [Butyrivibrio sp. M55]SFU75362.1 hypothetical protein SAMN05216540_10885 [Butyrivibrio sp. M55]
MKKRIIGVLLSMCIGVMAMGCSLDDLKELQNLEDVNDLEIETVDDSEVKAPTDIQTEDGESVSVAQESNGEDPFKNSELVKNGSATPVTEDGFYTATLQASGKNRAGNPNEDGNVSCIAYDTALTNSELLIKGVYGYSSVDGGEMESNSDDDSFSFKVDANTKFTMLGGVDGPEEVPLESFKQVLSSCADSELILMVTVEGGVAKEVSISS